jgi:hypothetical protein
LQQRNTEKRCTRLKRPPRMMQWVSSKEYTMVSSVGGQSLGKTRTKTHSLSSCIIAWSTHLTCTSIRYDGRHLSHMAAHSRRRQLRRLRWCGFALRCCAVPAKGDMVTDMQPCPPIRVDIVRKAECWRISVSWGACDAGTRAEQQHLLGTREIIDK